MRPFEQFGFPARKNQSMPAVFISFVEFVHCARASQLLCFHAARIEAIVRLRVSSAMAKE